MAFSIPDAQRAVELVGPDELVLSERKPVWRPGPRQFLCKVDVVGLCFSDLKLLKQFSKHVRKSPVLSGVDRHVLAEYPAYVPDTKPTVPGHEPVVTVVEAGAEVTRVKPGQRYFIQADWRWLKTAASNGAFGYNFEGALQEYVLLDERIIVSPDGDSMLLPAPEGARSAAAFGLVEPWACVECSYITPERRALLPDGRLLVVVESGLDGATLRRFLASQPRPSRMVWVADMPPPAHLPVGSTKHLTSLDGAEPESYDDVLYFGHHPETVTRLFALASSGAIISIIQGEGRFGRPVHTAIGALHYRGLRLTGTPGHDPAEAYARIPHDGDIRTGDSIHVIGAGGPMGVMHVIRNLCQGVAGVTVVAADLSDERLAALARLAEPVARRHGVRYEGYNSSAAPRAGPFDYAVIMAPVPALVAAAVSTSAPRGVINIFAGIPVDRFGPLNLDACIDKGLFFIGTSGSRMEDMRVVLRKVEGGLLNTNVSVAAVCGLEGAIDGIRAVEKQAIPGKIMVYPACRGLPLTRLGDLASLMPEVARRMPDGVWTLEAERALLNRYPQ